MKGPVAVEVYSCGVLNPEMTFDLKNPRHEFISGLPPKERQQFYHSYRGLIIKGRVVRSFVKRSGLTQEKGLLAGREVSLFIHPGTTALQCASLNQKRLKGVLEQACCEGGGNAPCLLKSDLVLKNPQLIKGRLKSDKPQAEKSKSYQKASQLFRAKKYRQAIKLYEQLRQQGRLDLKGHYRLAWSLRQEDRCQQAIKPLEYIRDKGLSKQYWEDEKNIVRRGTFLLARCYAKLNKPSFASTILETYLLQPKLYRRELQQSLVHKDFGWIHTSKEYRQYRKEAETALGRR